MYANKMGHGRTVRMLDEAGELQAITDDRDESRDRPRQRRWPFSAPSYALKVPQIHSNSCHFHSNSCHFHSTGCHFHLTGCHFHSTRYPTACGCFALLALHDLNIA
jgi:hypothetical protein